jgi:hypothetical protein
LLNKSALRFASLRFEELAVKFFLLLVRFLQFISWVLDPLNDIDPGATSAGVFNLLYTVGMNPTRHTFAYKVWNFIFSVLFVAVLVAALIEMKEIRGGFLVSVSPFDALMMTFATFRITRLVVYDRITLWFREFFVDRKSAFMTVVADLLQCPWCIGVWSALIVVYAYFIFDWAWSVIFFLALAGAGSLLQVIANGIGWRAENLKKTTELL